MMPRSGVWRLDIADQGYPSQLREVPDPPESLWGIGDPSLLLPSLAMVGSRAATPYGKACTATFARCATLAGVCLVSGAAMGCDARAHETSLEFGGKTVAVLGCGPDVDYPAREHRLLARIRDEGCVVAEMPPGTPPKRYAFPRRNRIIAGLSRAVLVVEAGLPSGTFSTATHALDADREILAVPGSIFASGSAGTNRLLRDGATLVADPEDLLVAIARVGLVGSGAHIGADAGECGPVQYEDPILAAVMSGPVSPQEILDSSSIDSRELLMRLGELESTGIISAYPGGTYGPSKDSTLWHTNQRDLPVQDGAPECPHPEPPWWEPV